MLLIAENFIQIIFLILSRSQRTRESARTRSHLSKTHLTRNTYGMLQFVTNAGESQWAFDSPAVNLSFEAAIFEFVTSASVSARALLLGMEMKIAELRLGFGFLAVVWIWRSGLQHTNKIVSFRNYVAVLVFFMVLLSVTACRRKRCFLWPMANKVNITWQVKFKRFQMLFILRCKVKFCLTLCNLGLLLETSWQQKSHNKTSKLFNDAIENNWYDN